MGNTCQGLCTETANEVTVCKGGHDVPEDPPLAGRWLSAKGNIHVVGLDAVQWRSGDVTRLRKRRKAGGGTEYATELNGQQYTARLNENGQLQWSDGDLWTRDNRAPETGTAQALNATLARASESFHGALSSTPALSSATSMLSTIPVPTMSMNFLPTSPTAASQNNEVQETSTAPAYGSQGPSSPSGGAVMTTAVLSTSGGPGSPRRSPPTTSTVLNVLPRSGTDSPRTSGGAAAAAAPRLRGSDSPRGSPNRGGSSSPVAGSGGMSPTNSGQSNGRRQADQPQPQQQQQPSSPMSPQQQQAGSPTWSSSSPMSPSLQAEAMPTQGPRPKRRAAPK